MNRVKVQMRNIAFQKNVVLAIALCLSSCSVASAQFGRSRINYPLGNPTISPYLNLIGSGSGAGAGINYFGLVRPQQDFYQQSDDLRRGVYTNRQQSMQNRSRGQQRGNGLFRIGVTGHATSFRTFTAAGGTQQQGGLGTTGQFSGLSNQDSGGASEQSRFGNRTSGQFSGHGSQYSYGAAYNQSGRF